jgi:hypothetical protein
MGSQRPGLFHLLQNIFSKSSSAESTKDFFSRSLSLSLNDERDGNFKREENNIRTSKGPQDLMG